MIISRKTTVSTLIIPFLLIIVHFSQAAVPYQRLSREEYISRYKHIAIEHQKHYGIPASITMAQGILESDSGNSHLAKGSNNHFGIKCKSNWTGRTFAHTDDAPNECFRAYESVEASYADHAEFLDSSPRYDSLFRFDPTDYRSWARGLKGAGYATAPDYTARLIKLIEDNRLYMLDIEAVRGVAFAEEQPKDGSYRASIDPNNFRVTIDTHNGYNIYRTNHTCYTISKSGDTIKSLSKSFKLSEKRLAKYNDLESINQPIELDIIYVERKQREWLNNSICHTVAEGETLHSISQRYAIRQSSLRKMNKLKRGEELVVGMNLTIE